MKTEMKASGLIVLMILFGAAAATLIFLGDFPEIRYCAASLLGIEAVISLFLWAKICLKK